MAKKRGQHGRAVTGVADRQPRKDAAARWRTTAIVTVAIALLVLTGLACVLSYPSLHALASQAAVSSAEAKLYPTIFDAMLVIAGAAVLALRGAGLFSRIYAWLSLLVLLAALAAGGVVRAADITVPHKSAAIAAAAIPWALVLIGFGLLVTLLGYARRRRSGGRAAQAVQARPQAQPEANDQGPLGVAPADGAGTGEPGAGAQDLDNMAGTAVSPGQARVKAPARPADLQLRARVPASRTPAVSEMSPHEITAPSGTTVPATTGVPGGRPPGPASATSIGHPDSATDAPPPGTALPPVSSDSDSDSDSADSDSATPSGAPHADTLIAAASQTVPNRVQPAVADDMINDDPASLAPNAEAVAEPAEPPAASPAEPPEFRRPHGSPTPPD